MQSIIFFLGKGGVGKSTMAVLTSLYRAKGGEGILLTSLDPAHNLSHILEKKLSPRPKKVTGGVTALEVDPKRLTRSYLKTIEDDLRRAYSYQTAFNLSGHFNLIRHSPGIEEYALLRAFYGIVQRHNDKDCLIFDMPPTALTLKFFRLPFLSLLWLEEIRSLRMKIKEKKEMITTITMGRKKIEGDRVLGRIEKSMEEYRLICDLFLDAGRTSIRLVMNPDRLSRLESHAIKDELAEMGISISRVALNKCEDTDTTKDTARYLKLPTVSLPLSCEPLLGLTRLIRYTDDHRSEFEALEARGRPLK